jgi:hypothetical protein
MPHKRYWRALAPFDTWLRDFVQKEKKTADESCSFWEDQVAI